LGIAAIIFDHDGTLVDSEGVHFTIWQQLLSDNFGIKFNKQEYLNHHCGTPTLRNAELIVQQHGLNLNPQDLCDLKQQALQVVLNRNPFPLMPFALEALDLGKQAGVKMGVATGANHSEVTSSISSHKLEDFFQTIVSKDDVDNSKPAPDTYLKAALELGVEPRECMAIEDSLTGIRAAQAAGMTCIAVTYAFSKHQDLSLADYRVDNLKQAVEIALGL